MKNYLRTQITLYEEDKKEEASMRCSLLHDSCDQILQRRPSVRLSVRHFIAATAIKPPKAACQFAADDILLYEFCYYNPMDLLHHLGKDKEESSPLQYHIKFLQYQDITRRVC